MPVCNKCYEEYDYSQIMSGPHTCGKCIHIKMERIEWNIRIEKELTNILMDRNRNKDILRNLLNEHKIILPELSITLREWTYKNFDTLNLSFINSLDNTNISNSLSYMIDKSEELRFRNILDGSEKEREVAEYLSNNHRALRMATGYCHPGDGGYCMHEFRFGSDFIADFLILNPRRSLPPLIYLVELEPVGDNIFTKKGTPSHKLLTALHQIKQWRSWIQDNRLAFCNEVDKRLKRAVDARTIEGWLMRKTVRLDGYIFIGRRSKISDNDQRHLWSDDGENTTIHTYDTILDKIRSDDHDTLSHMAEIECHSLVVELRKANYKPLTPIDNIIMQLGQID